jgi:hypothetical protein
MEKLLIYQTDYDLRFNGLFHQVYPNSILIIVVLSTSFSKMHPMNFSFHHFNFIIFFIIYYL